ncbi:fimbrial protein [Paraburkholderia sediminicola]|uniref:fimbrial protein n=1 Tax=Paraburkholderia sediminicola TaxID=458836 RepID=UPI0038BAFF58
MNSTEAMTTGREDGIKPIGKRSVKHVGAWMLQTLCAGLLMLCSIHAQADYVHLPYVKGWTDNFDNLAFSASFSPSRDISIGTVLQSVNANGKISYNVTCPVTRTVTVTGTPVSGMTDTYQTNVPGIGVHFYVTAGWSGGNYTSVPSTQDLPASSAGPVNFYTRADLVVTGPVGNGTLTTLPSMTLNYTGTCITDPAYNSPHSQSLNTGTTIAGRTCSVTTPSVNVALPTVFPSNFSTGSAGATPFSLGVSCTQGVTVKVTLTDASNVGNTSTTLGLAPDSSAAGVGLQILSGSTPIAYGPDSAVAGNVNQWSAGTTTGGPMNIPLTVRYIRTTGAITPGTVKGAATFTMSYQ